MNHNVSEYQSELLRLLSFNFISIGKEEVRGMVSCMVEFLILLVKAVEASVYSARLLMLMELEFKLCYK